MASYWKSPYKETTNSYHSNDSSTDSLTPRKDISLSKLQTSSSNSYEWLDRTSPIKSPDFHLRRLRANAGTIKGILKTPTDLEGLRTARTEKTSETQATSPRTNSTTPRREKKKVTFGHSEYSIDNEQMPSRSRVRHDRSMSAHYYRLKHVQPLDEYARQNLKKLLGYVAGAGPLPSVKGKALVSSEDTDHDNIVSTDGVKCRHSTDLRCARCFRDNDAKTLDSEVAAKSGASTSKPEAKSESAQDFDNNCLVKNESDSPEVLLPQDVTLPNASLDDNNVTLEDGPTKRSAPHWTRSFIRSPINKHSARHLIGRHVRSANGQRKKWTGGIIVRHLEPLPVQVVNEDLTRLHITGDGKIIRIKSNDDDKTKALNNSTVENDTDCVVSPGSASSNGRVGYKIPATPTTHMSTMGTSQDPSHPPNSAPTKPIRVGSRYDSSNHTFVRHRDTDMERYLDKTSQILTWLKDVRQKQNYVPRKSRLYALEPQQLH